jgi:hypothetical protein
MIACTMQCMNNIEESISMLVEFGIKIKLGVLTRNCLDILMVYLHNMTLNTVRSVIM